MPVYQIEMDPGREFWEKVFVSFGANEGVAVAGRVADEALAEWRKRWEHQISEATFGIPGHQIFPAPAPIPSPMERLVHAQEELEKLERMRDSIRALADQMPKELGEAYFGVAGQTVDDQIESAQQWVRNIQAEMEHSAVSAPTTSPEHPLGAETSERPQQPEESSPDVAQSINSSSFDKKENS